MNYDDNGGRNAKKAKVNTDISFSNNFSTTSNNFDIGPNATPNYTDPSLYQGRNLLPL